MKHFTGVMAILAGILVLIFVIIAGVSIKGKLAESQKNIGDAQDIVNSLTEKKGNDGVNTPKDKTTLSVSIPSKEVTQTVKIVK